ncbi:hypothetical protein [Streptomyces sp. YIM S03343]
MNLRRSRRLIARALLAAVLTVPVRAVLVAAARVCGLAGRYRRPGRSEPVICRSFRCSGRLGLRLPWSGVLPVSARAVLPAVAGPCGPWRTRVLLRLGAHRPAARSPAVPEGAPR